MKETTFAAACKAYFGYAEGQSLAGFSQEIKALTPKDKADLTPLLEAALNVKITASPSNNVPTTPAA